MSSKRATESCAPEKTAFIKGDQQTTYGAVRDVMEAVHKAGLSDVMPVAPFARALVMIEELAGLAYVAMLVSRLVALTVMRR